ncbi:MAG: NAD(P)H-dependent oxidoreductase [Rhizobiales bacterium]|nr:NAD(P)H-dependent oxidoreductase [Hyphomicrobiales bacterium]
MKILVIFAHPKPSGSVVQKALLAAITGLPNVTVHDLYAAHPHFAIDVPAEQHLLLAHDLIVLQHPFYWYSSPAIIKEWLDLVLENGWAYGPGGTRLSGKFMMQAVSTGGSGEAYQAQGRNRFTVDHLLVPFNQTAYLCGMAYLEAFAIHAGRRMATSDLITQAEAYRDLIVGLRDGLIDPLAMLAPGYSLPPAFHSRAA